jgi:adenylate cyclase, class 2
LATGISRFFQRGLNSRDEAVQYTADMSAIETEVKFRVANIASLENKLQQLGFNLLTPSTFERNILYDTAERTLRARQEIMRLRRYGDNWIITHKGLPRNYNPLERHKKRVETETRVEDGEAVATIFERLGFVPVFAYEKWRTEWADATGHCVVDETPIGVFAELEGPEAWIDEVGRGLGLDTSEFMTLSYGKLFDIWKEETGSNVTDMTFEAIGQVAPR